MKDWSEHFLVPCSFSEYEEAGYMRVESCLVYIVGNLNGTLQALFQWVLQM